MSTNTTLFAHIANRKLKSQTEDTAVEALGYILSSSSAAGNLLQNVLREGCTQINSISRVETWERDEKGAIPDLVCFDEDGTKHVLIEAKFWATLTCNQPNQYLNQLQQDRQDRPAVLLFVAPKSRLDSLWPELCERVKKKEPKFELSIDSDSGDLRTASIGGGKLRLLLTSWAALLGGMEVLAREAGDMIAVGDIRQLRGLTDYADPDHSHPWRPGELGSEFARRMEGLRRLVDDSISYGRSAGFLKPKKVAAGGGGGYGRQIQLGGTAAWLGIEVFSWAQYRNTPLWLRFGRSSQGQLEQAGLTNQMFDPGPGWDFRIPIELLAGVEYDEMLTSVVNRMKSIAEQLNPDSMADAADDSDARQLRGRADRIDPHAFMPWLPEELEPELAKQVTSLHGIIEEATSCGKNAGFLKGKRFSPRQEGYGWTFRLGGVKTWFGIHFGGWARHRDTPLWLTFEDDEPPKLANLTDEIHEVNWKPSIPIYIPATAEHDEVLESVVASLKRIAGQLEASDA